MRDDRQQDLSASGAEHAGDAGDGDAASAGMRRLYELHARLAGETHLPAALREILITAIQAAGAHRGTVLLVSEDRQRLEIAAHHGYESPEELLEHGSGPACEAAWRERRPIVIDDTGVDGVPAVTCTPIITRGGDVAGVLCTEFQEPHRPGDDEPRMTGLLAWIAGGLVERHRAEVALRKSEEQGSALVSMLPGSAVFIVDTELRYRFAGGEALRDAGYSSERFLGRTPEEVVGPALAAEHAPNYRRVLGGEPFEVEHAAHGRIFLTRGTPLRDGAGTVTGALVISTDVTARQTAAAALRESGERQAFLLALSDALRAEADALSVQEQAVRMVAEHLRLDRCWISEVFEQQGISTVGPEHRRPDLSPLSGVFRLSDYNETMRQLATQPMVVYDAPGDPRFADAEKELLAGLRLGALLVVPLRRGPQPVVWALAAAVATPREWTDGERVLLQEAAERTWAAIERARGQAAATRAERHAERLIERMGDAHCVLDRDFRIVRVNAAAERLLGVPRDQMLGRSHRDVFPESVNAPADLAFRRVKAEGTKQYLTHHYMGAGYDLHLEVDAYPTDEGGVAMFWRDVTERVRGETALRASEERYRALFNEMDEAYAVVEVLADAEGRWADFRFLEVNPAFVRHTGMPYPVGRTATELLGMPNPRWAELYGRAADTGETVRVEEAELTLGRTFDLNIFRLGGEGSRRVAVLFADVTERRRAEDALRESEERYRSLFESMDEGFALCELVRDDQGRAADYRYVELNPALVRHSGITPGALRGRRATEVFPDLDPWLIQTYRRVVETGESVIAEHYIPHVDRWLRINAFPRGGDRFAVLFGDVTERKRTEEELRESERRYRLLFENMGEGFALAELIRDEDGRPIDWRYLEVNDGWAQTGVPAGETVGRTAREVNPAIEPGWIEAYGRVVRTGEPTRYEAYAKGYGKWFDTVAFRHSENRFGVILRDVTARREAEAALRASAERQAFLLKLGDALRLATSASGIERAAARTLGAQLGANRAFYAGVDGADWLVAEAYEDGVEPQALGRHPLAQFGGWILDGFRAGERLVIRDLHADPRFDAPQRAAHAAYHILAAVAVPLVKEGVLAAILVVHSATPRDWSEHEIALVEETAERTWAAVGRARAEAALRESEARYRSLFTSIDEGFCILEPLAGPDGVVGDIRYVQTNPAFARQSGVPLTTDGRTYRELTGHAPQPDWLEICASVVRTGDSVHREWFLAPTGRWVAISAGRLDDGASHRIACVLTDVTERRLAEETLRTSQERQAFLLGLSDALRAETDVNAVADRAIRMLIEHLRLDRSYIVSYRLEEDRAYLVHQRGNDTVPPLPDVFILSAYPAAVRAIFDQTLVIEDEFERRGLSEAERRPSARLGMRAMVAATLRKAEGRPLWSLVAISSLPRRWTPGEIALVEEVAERTWAAVERTRAGEALRASEERQAFLLKVSDALRPLADPLAMIAAASELMGRHLDAGRCGYGELPPPYDHFVVERDWTHGMPSHRGRWRLADFGDEFVSRNRAGGTLVIDDALADARGEGVQEAMQAAGGLRASIGVPLVKEGNWVAGFFVHDSRPRRWTEGDVGLVEEVAERTWAAVERARVEAALRESEEKYRNLFEWMGQGYSLNEVVRDAEGAATDVRYLELNPAFERLTGASLGDARGRLASEVFPGLDRYWVDICDRAARTGVIERVEHELTPNGRWYESNFYPLGRDRVMSLYDDITERKHAEIVLRASEERQAFLLGLTDALRPLDAAAGIQGEATRRLREHLDAGWCCYVEWDEAAARGVVLRDAVREGLPSLAGAHDVPDVPGFFDTLRTGNVLNVRDGGGFDGLPPEFRARCTALGFRSMMVATLVKQERLIASLLVGDTGVRDWSGDAEALLMEVAERTWTAVGRTRAEAALRESEERQAFLLRFSDALRAEPDAGAIAMAALRLVAAKLGVDRCYVTTMDLAAGLAGVPHQIAAPGVPPVPAVIYLNDYPAQLQRIYDGTLVVHDAENQPGLTARDRASLAALHFGALVAATLRRVEDGVPRPIWGVVAVSAAPRRWTPDEVALLEEVAERTWAAMERARGEAALRESGERLRLAVEATGLGVSDWDLASDRVVANARFREIFGLPPEDEILGATLTSTMVHPDDLARVGATMAEAMGAGTSGRFEVEHRALTPGGERWLLTLGQVHFSREEPGRRAVRILGNHLDITARKRAEAALRASEARLQLALEAAELAVFEWDLASDRVIGSARFREMYGVGPDEPVVTSAHALSAVHPHDRAIVDEHLRRAMSPASSGHYVLEHRVIHPGTDRERWVQTHGQVYFEGAGADRRAVRVLGTGLDATERKHAEAVLRDREERQAFLLALSDALRPLADPVEVQSEAARVIGQHLRAGRAAYCEIDADAVHFTVHRDYTDGVPSFAGRYLFDGFGRAPVADLRAGITACIADTESDARLDASERAAYAAAQVRAAIGVPLVKGGRCSAAFSVQFAVPHEWTAEQLALVEETAERTWAAVERTRAEGALRESEERFRLFAEASSDVLWMRDAERLQWEYLSPAFESIYGYPRSEVMGPGDLRKWADLIEPEDREHALGMIERVRGGERVTFEYRVRRRDGELRWLRNTDFPMRDAAGRVRRIGGIGQDVTEQKNREEIQALLMDISADLGRLSTEEEIVRMAGARLAARLGLACYHYVDVDEDRGEVTVRHFWHAQDVPSTLGTFPIAGFVTPGGLDRRRAGVTDVVHDVQRDVPDDTAVAAALKAGAAAQKIGAYIAVPYSRNGRWKAYFAAADSQPRRWTAAEVELVQEVANRVFPRIERARAEAALRESGERLRLATEVTELAVFEWDLESDRVAGNERFRRWFGFAPGERMTSAQILQERVHPADLEFVQDRLRRAMDPGAPGHYSFEYRLAARGEDGERWLLTHGQVYFAGGEAERPVRILGTNLDVTARRRAEAALRESAERQAFLLKLSDILQRLTTPVDIRAAATEILGRHLGVSRVQYHEVDESGEYYGADGVGYADGLPLLDLTYRIDQFGSFVAEDFEAGRPFRSDDLLADPRPTAAEREVYRLYGIRAGAGVPLLRGGRLVAILAVHDTSPHPWTDLEMELIRETAERVWVAVEKVRTETVLRESEERFRTVAELVPDLLWHSSPDGATTWLNQRWLDYTGQTHEEAVGWGWTLAVHPDDRRRSAANYQRAMEIGGVFVQEHRLRRHDGAFRWFLVRAEPIRDPAGVIQHWFGAATDIHHQRAAMDVLEERVAERTAELVRADEARREVLRQLVTAEEDERRRISRELHDSLGQLVTGLLLGLKALPRDGETARIEDLERLADRIAREMQNMAVQLRPPALDNLGLRLALQAHAEEWSHRYALECDFHYAGVDGERFSAEVETTLYRVVQEGLNNVVKHAGATRVSLLLERRSGMIATILEDDGRGFDVEATLASPHKARRLGLRGMRERVALLGGEMEIESSEGAGTTLYVRIPLPAGAEGNTAGG